MQIAVIGAGNVGATLALKWAAAGHTVVFGARDTSSPKVHAALASAGAAVQAAPIAAALAPAEVVLLAMPGAAVAAFAQEHGAALAGKLVIDATNQFGQAVPNSLATLAAAAPTALLARAFSTLAWESFADPVFGGVPADLFYCAPAGAASTQLESLITAVGLRPVRVGDRREVALVDNLTQLWRVLAYEQGNGRRVALKVLV